ncbi:MAG: hypothetical protein ACRDDY_03260 [Clostridium sp.]|uniref:hypothetical protein n=1 Tax=Clostridium sp. TaxID=1506 RepID=UPI003EE60E42
MLTILKRYEGAKPDLDITKHYSEREKDRNVKAKKNKIHDMFIVEKDSIIQLHIILTDATIVIADLEHGTVVTTLNARAQQIKRYYKAINDFAPKFLLESADKNEAMNLHLL